jgi:hypothetical protein
MCSAAARRNSVSSATNVVHPRFSTAGPPTTSEIPPDGLACRQRNPRSLKAATEACWRSETAASWMRETTSSCRVIAMHPAVEMLSENAVASATPRRHHWSAEASTEPNAPESGTQR